MPSKWIRSKEDGSRYEGTFRYMEGGVHKLMEVEVVHDPPTELHPRWANKMLSNFSGIEEVPGP